MKNSKFEFHPFPNDQESTHSIQAEKKTKSIIYSVGFERNRERNVCSFLIQCERREGVFENKTVSKYWKSKIQPSLLKVRKLLEQDTFLSLFEAYYRPRGW